MNTLTQILRQADTLKVTLSESGKKISELWVSRQRLEDLYERLLLMDLEYALDKKVEQDLWNHAFKNQINLLQIQAKDKQNVKRGENQASLNLFLETASGFYLQLLQQICTTFKLDLPFLRKSASLGVMDEKCRVKRRSSSPKKTSCLYICQHCLVHLGDIARYRQQVEQAQTYYRHAAQLVPQNGQPYNQLAILEAARGNKLSTVFYYIRSLAVRHPFPVAATNLEKFYIKLTREIGDIHGKMSLSEVINTFLQFIALVHLSSDLNKAANLREHLMASLPSHVTSQSFTTTVLLEMVAITVFSLSHTQKNFKDCEGEDSHYSMEEEQAMELIQGFALTFLDMLLQATPKHEQKAKDFFTLPPIKVLLDWIHLNPDVLLKPQLRESSLWIGLAKLFNSIQDPTELENYSEIPLPEDCELRCFQPLEQAYNTYTYTRLPVGGLSTEIQTKLRCERLLNHGKWLVQHVSRLNLLNCMSLKSGRLQFTTPNIMMAGIEPVGQGYERKHGRQNVAIQAIIQKKKKPEDYEIKTPMKQIHEEGYKTGSQTSSGQSSPKYLLGIPTNEPQFMKHGGGKPPSNLSNMPTYPRYPSPTIQQPSPPNVGSGKSPTLSKSLITMPGQGTYGFNNQTNVGGKPPGHFQENMGNQFQPSPPLHTKQIPPSMSPGPQLFNKPGQPPHPQEERGRMLSSMPALSQNLASPDNPPLTISPALQQHLQTAMLQSSIPQQPFPNMSTSQLLQVMKLANQLSSEQQIVEPPVPVPGKQMDFSHAPRKEKSQPLPKPDPTFASSPRMTNFPSLYGASGYSGLTSSPLRPILTFGPMSNQPQLSKEPGTAPINTVFGGFSPGAIQPQPTSDLEMRHSSAFQGHAEGTPKPDNFSLENRDSEKSGNKGAPQPRTYSLFSSSPWEVTPLPGGGEPSLSFSGIGSSFSSASNSMRNSTDPDSSLSPYRPNTSSPNSSGPS